MELHERAYAKLNLTLDVLGTRADGYHEMCMVMQSVSLCDEVSIRPGRGGMRVESNLRFLPTDGRNLAAMAAEAFYRALDGAAAQTAAPALDISIQKRIPVCAGLAGGSSDAAAVLRALNRTLEKPLSTERLAQIGREIGSDVPFCVGGGTALATGRGEELEALPALPDCAVVLCKPSFPISTPALFSMLDRVKLHCRPDTQGVLAALRAGDLAGVARRMYNVFEDVLPRREGAEVAAIKRTLIARGCLGASMSGSGPTVFALFDDEALAQQAAAELSREYQDVFLARPV